ncbi:MAG TPA: protocatechuate 3,4-dioxygenase subunit alpha [Solirubrobacteraceae bacterium]|nr:protocatechuate 3,4-dioxygenase subunit alpha [Solirubrobacteraceae bacterium]
MIFEVTPSQTVGPYFAIGVPFDGGNLIVPEGTPGAIRIGGTIYDGRGEIIPDHLIEFWQPDGEGRFNDICGYGEQSTLEGFRGFGRYGVEDGDGVYTMVTVKPGRVPGPNEGPPQAPHIDVTLFARGMLNRVVTRVYFADEEQANAADPVLATVPAARRNTLLAQPTADGYRFDIHLQGPGETVFFDI